MVVWVKPGVWSVFWVLISTSKETNAVVTLQRVPQQCVQLRVELGLLLQHVEEQLVLCGAGDLRLLQPALHHLHLRLSLGCLEPLKRSECRLYTMLTLLYYFYVSGTDAFFPNNC